MKRVVTTLLVFAALAALVIITIKPKDGVRAVYANSGCSVANLNGNYGFTVSGFSSIAPGGRPTQFPFAAVGLATFDGEGNLSGTFTYSFNGSSSTDNPYTGTYTVNPNCTGLLTSTDGGDNFAFVIVSGGADVLATDVSAGTTTSLEFKKQ